MAMYALAFSAFLRVGELTVTQQNDVMLELDDCGIITEADGLTVLSIKLRHFKGNVGGTPFTIIIPASQSKYCTVQLMKNYLTFRGISKGPLFLLNNRAVTRIFFSIHLKFHLERCGYDPKYYKGHSFRIGAATAAAAAGLSDSDIQKLGRWNSNAFKRYIRIPTLFSS